MFPGDIERDQWHEMINSDNLLFISSFLVIFASI